MAGVQQKPARDILIDALHSWGIDTTGEISNLVDKYIKAGIFNAQSNADTVQLYLQDTKEWKQRFAGIEVLRKEHPNLPVPSIAEYLATERQYQNIMQAAGLPKGFYDSPADFAQFIGNGVSPSELQNRVQAAVDASQNLEGGYRNYLAQAGYGALSLSHLAAYMLDPKRALPTIQRDLASAQVAGTAAEHGLNITNAQAQRINAANLTSYQLRTGLDSASQALTQAQRLGNIYGNVYNEGDALNEFLLGRESAYDKRMSLVNKEKSSFSGSGAVGTGSLARDIGSY